MDHADHLQSTKFSNIFITCESFSKRFKILNKIGEGHTANVFKIENRHTKQQFALKAFNHRNFRSTRLIQEKTKFFDEKYIIDEILELISPESSEHVIKIHEAFSEKSEKFLVMQLMRGSLRHDSVEAGDVSGMLLQIARLLESVHAEGFVHLDIRPGENY